MSYYVSSLPVRKHEVYSRIAHELKTKQYRPNSVSVCFYASYTEYVFYSSDDYDVGHGIVFGLTVRTSGGQSKCSFFCSGPSHSVYIDPMTDESDFKIKNEYAPYLISVAAKHGFTVNSPEGYMVDNIVYFNEYDACRASQRDKEIKQKSRQQIPKKKDDSTTKILIGIAIVLLVLYLLKS